MQKKNSQITTLIVGIIIGIIVLAALVLFQGGVSSSTGRVAGYSSDIGFRCADSDNGLNIVRVGTVTYTITNVTSNVVASTKNYVDSCAGPSLVREWYCEGSMPQTVMIYCDKGKVCREGMCIPN